MKASINWIKEMLPELNLSSEEIAAQLTSAGLEVEAIEPVGHLPGVVTAEVKTVKAHPNADRLRVTEVFDGEQTHTVVCGAPNVAAGQRVVFAPAGVTLPNGLTLSRRDIRGVESSGMICSQEELGLAEHSDGIWVLDADVLPGQPAAWALSLADTILELGITPNRGDALSHLGLARELAALNQLPAPDLQARPVEQPEAAGDRAQVEVADERCLSYHARVVTGVKVGPSPQWLQNHLRAVGLRPINNVVDVTNFILLGLGQPMHAFDLSKLRGQQIHVRGAGQGESLSLLNGSEVRLSDADLVIADAEGPVALAGVMGGANSEVEDDTTELLLEAAIFSPTTVRRTARRLAIHSDSSHRFERGIDPKLPLQALDRCAELIVEVAGGEVQGGVLGPVSPPPEPKILPIRASRASMLIGREVSEAEVIDALERLGLEREESRPPELEAHFADALLFRVPSWRLDLGMEVDLIEEVARLHGYEDIVGVMPTGSRALNRRITHRMDDQARAALVAQGFYECISLAFHARDAATPFGCDARHGVSLANPLGTESQLMRMSLLPAMIKAARLNQDQLPRELDLRFFEAGRCFSWADPPGALPVEELRLALMMRGQRAPVGWDAPNRLIDVFDLKGVLEALLDVFGLTARVRFEAVDRPWLHPRSATALMLDEVELGVFGELHPELAENAGLTAGAPLFIAELSLDRIPQEEPRFPHFKALPKQPPVQRDLSFFLPLAQQSAAVLATARAAGGDLVEAVRVFDIYEGEGVPQGQRSLALAFTLRHPDRSLTDVEADDTMDTITDAIVAAHDAQLRGA